jgi:hypothetical protein
LIPAQDEVAIGDFQIDAVYLTIHVHIIAATVVRLLPDYYSQPVPAEAFGSQYIQGTQTPLMMGRNIEWWQQHTHTTKPGSFVESTKLSTPRTEALTSKWSDDLQQYSAI